MPSSRLVQNNICSFSPHQHFSDRLLELANKLQWKFGQAQTNGYLGINYAVKSDYTKSIAHFQTALAAHEELGNKSNVATTLVNLGNIYLLTSDYPHALEYYLRALKIQEEIGYSKGIALSLSNIGLIYKNQSEYAKALEYFLRALEINESGGTKNNIANNLSSIGIVYENQQDYPKALEYFSRALKIQEELKVTDGIAKTLSYIGSVYAQLINNVTVLFADIRGFTRISEQLNPKELVDKINECFSAFDHIMEQHNVEKIKTIGDAYMAAGGLPTPNTTHAGDVVKAALAMQQFMHDQKTQSLEQGIPFFEIRIGIHSGPVIAGIVGIRKFAYDIWGDTVNLASRMESSGHAGKINISQRTYDLIKDQYHCIHRGKVSTKDKGDIDMYFVESTSSFRRRLAAKM
ncbi:MAG: tetratricopeptide repeat protein [Phaeodactylibacter sp.]|nr:tetratricopeptide repeat protein [Phaeodactylibacter sp.]